MAKQIVFTRAAIRALQRAPTNEAARIRSKITQYARDPASLANNVRKLQSRPGFRLRVGDWRVIFDEDDRVLDILEVGPRGSVYG